MTSLRTESRVRSPASTVPNPESGVQSPEFPVQSPQSGAGRRTLDAGRRTQDAGLSPRLLAIGAILVAFALRLYKLGAESLWYDETVSVFLARQSIPELIAHTARDIHPPGYYLLLHLWGWLAQPTLQTGLEFIYAWPSLFWGVLLIPLIFALGRRFFTTRVALAALWLTAVHPYHIWYSQEVRMYTLGAGLGLLCLWGASGRWQVAGGRRQVAGGKWKVAGGQSPAPSPQSPVPSSQSPASPIHNSPFTIHHSLFLYILAAAAGLYTLYYFAFLLIALNLLVIWHHFATRRSLIANPQSPFPNPQSLLAWLLANAAALLLWSPWLPVFWRQMSDPPVPPWRVPLDLPALLQESLAALLVGQSPPLATLWPWALLSGLLLCAFVVAVTRRPYTRAEWTIFAFVLLPLLLIAVVSLTVTPLYHIRYFFTYAAAGTLLLAVILDKTVGHWRWLHAISLAGLMTLSAWSLAEFWTNPLYRADDHRAAVTELAANWRPGDAMLVNAGWAYTALAVYWPAAPSPNGAQPISPLLRTRLYDYANGDNLTIPAQETPFLLLGGSVDGSANLGWGLAESDFYAISRAATEATLAEVTARHPRLWHYRLYDTVSDRGGAVRGWLDAHTTPRLDLPYPGRDFLRVQLFETAAFANQKNCPQTPGTAVTFGDGVVLRGASYSPAPQAGSSLYAILCWEIGADIEAQNLRTSLRLYALVGTEALLLAQKDESPFLNVATRNFHQTALALPIPAATPPGNYRLEVIVYDGATGDPLPINNARAIVGQRWPLTKIVISEQ